MYAEHQLVGIARVRLGRAILRQRRYSEAESESRAGYELLMKQTSPPANWLSKAHTDLAEEYAALNKPERQRYLSDSTCSLVISPLMLVAP
jgi:eukaryotic-like serine/threonine-protein kinase